MKFTRYQHLERFGTTEVENIELGTCHVFPKLDGTNASLWFSEGELQAGSRKRHLTLVSDNAGFYAWAKEQPRLLEYLHEHPTHRLYGEWLVPHALKTYRQDAWRQFYVFDVAVDKPLEEILQDGDSTVNYLPYEVYSPLLEAKGINYIKPLAVLKNANFDQFIAQLELNNFLIEDDRGVGEGIVLKNYDFKNKFNRQKWAKIVTSEFKEKHGKIHKTKDPHATKMLEEKIAETYVTVALCEKVYAKIDNESGFTSKTIPRLLHTIYYDVITEETWNFVKKHKNPTINFSALQHYVYQKAKENLPHLF